MCGIKNKLVAYKNWIYAFIIVLLFYGTYTYKFVTEEQLENDYRFALNGLVIVSTILFLTIGIIGWMLSRSDFKLERIFLVAAVGFGVVMSLLLPPGCTEDECSHITSAFYYCERPEAVLLSNREENVVYVRQGDIPMLKILDDYENSQVPSIGYYRKILDGFELRVSDSSTTPMPKLGLYFFVAQTGNFLLYLPASLGVMVGRFLRLGFWPLFYLARLFNFVTFLLLCYYGIKKLPVGKMSFLFAAILPNTMGIAASVNYDAINIGICYLFLGYLLARAYDGDDFDSKDKIVLYISSMLLGFTKGGLYILLAGFALILINDLKDRRNLFEAGRIIGFSLCGYIVNVVIARLVFNYVQPVSSIVTNGNRYGEQVTHTVSEITVSPLDFVFTVIRSFTETTGNWLLRYFGRNFAWGDIELPYTFPLILFLFIIASVFYQDIDGKRALHTTEDLIQRDRAVYLLVFLAFTLVSYFMMFIAATPAENMIITNVRFRYYAPFIPMAFILFPARADKDNSKYGKLVWSYVIMSSICILRLYMQIIGNGIIFK